MKNSWIVCLLVVLPIVLAWPAPLKNLLKKANRNERSLSGYNANWAYPQPVAGYQDPYAQRDLQIKSQVYNNPYPVAQPQGYADPYLQQGVYDPEKEQLKNQVNALNDKVDTLERIMLKKEEASLDELYNKRYGTPNDIWEEDDREYEDIYDDDMYDDEWDRDYDDRDYDDDVYDRAYDRERGYDDGRDNKWDRENYVAPGQVIGQREGSGRSMDDDDAFVDDEDFFAKKSKNAIKY
jgi:hypothetical protein